MVNSADSDSSALGGARLRGSASQRPHQANQTPEYRVTSVGETPAEERSRRMRAYYIAMSLRVLCVASLAFVRGWWIIIPALGAVLLPYFAVMIGNAIGAREGEAPSELTPQALTASESDLADSDAGSPGLIVVDAPAERRATSVPTQAAEGSSAPAPPRPVHDDGDTESGKSAPEPETPEPGEAAR